MGQVFIRTSTAALLFLIGTLTIVCVALMVLLMAPDWRNPGGEIHSSSIGDQNQITNVPVETTPKTTTTESQLNEPWEKQYRIPETTVPIHYDLYLHPNLDTGLYTGHVTILIGVVIPMNYLVVHVKEMNITSTMLKDSSMKSMQLKESFEYKPNQFWVVQPESTLSPGNYSLKLYFNGSLDGDIVGFYRSVYKTKSGEERSIATSKFQPTDARGAFPCFDEPSFKSTFIVTMVRPSKGYIALSNMPVELEIKEAPSADLTEVVFEKSVPMVTYLVCFIVCDFVYVETLTKEGKKFRVYATEDQIGRANYAKDIGVHILNTFETYFGVEYPLPKQDMIAIPDFVSGAMEHWGLITYRESNLLYNDESSSSYNKQRVASVVSHELAHMWFGNLVTLKWWDDLWLNEGFASYIEYMGVASYEKDWDMEAQLITNDLQPVLCIDAQLSSHPIVQTVNHPDEIKEIFDAISYKKGASVLKMLESFMGSEDFRLGIHNFLMKFKYQNAVTQDLWDELTATSTEKLAITTIMDSWTRQMGFPVITVSKSATDPNSLEVRQQRFLSDPGAVSADDSPYNYKWEIPVTFTTNNTPRTLVWLHKDQNKLIIPKPPGTEWIKFNSNQTGYYRVNYDVALWNQLIKLLNTDHEALSPQDRSSLLNDAFNLAAADILDYDIVLGMVNYMAKEQHYIPWESVESSLGSLELQLRRTETYPLFREYMVKLVKDHTKRLGWKDDGTHLERRNRISILHLACSNGEYGCLDEAYTRFQQWIKDPNYVIPPNLRSLVYKYGIKKAGVDEWEELLQRYIKEINSQEKSKMLRGLTSTREEWLLYRLMNIAKNESIIRSQDYFSALTSMSSNPAGLHIVWSFIRDNWEDLVDRFSLNNRYLGRAVKSVAQQFNTEFELNEVKAFFKTYPDSGAGRRAREQALEQISKSIKWISKNQKPIHSWLEQQPS